MVVVDGASAVHTTAESKIVVGCDARDESEFFVCLTYAYAPFAFVTRRRASTPSPREWAREMADVADAFDAALNLEESHLDEGWEDGLRCVLRGRGHAMRLFSSERGARPPPASPSSLRRAPSRVPP